MVSIYGLNDKIGNISFYDPQGNNTFVKPYSEETAKVIDEEVSAMIEEQYERALRILTENQDKLSLLAEKLLKSEVIFKEDLIEIFGKRAWDKDSHEAKDTEQQVNNDEIILDAETENNEEKNVNSAEDTSGSENEPISETDQELEESEDKAGE